MMYNQFSARSVLLTILVAWFANPSAKDANASLLLHSSLDNAEAVLNPEVAAATYSTMAEAIPGPGNTTFESGQVGMAARLDNAGFPIDWPVDGPVRFHGDNFDFDDPAQDGGRLDFWVKFNENPHTTTANTWLARTNWGQRYINYEWSGNAGQTANMMIDVYSDVAHNYRTNFEKFRVLLRGWSAYENISAGEWHVFTFTWRNNGGPHKAEIHVYIDGSQAGCIACSDFNGNLPPEGSITDFFFSPDLNGAYLLFSIDEIYSFDSWDVSGISGNFPTLQIPEGVVLKYPMDKRSPVWGSPAPNGNVLFEFTVNNDQSAQCECDLFVDGQAAGSVTAASGAHTEIAPPDPIPAGSHTWQLFCDNGRLVSPLNEFEVTRSIPVNGSSVGGLKKAFQGRR